MEDDNYYTTGDEEQEGEQQEQRPNSDWAALRQVEKRAKQAERQLAEATRKLAFIEAGVDTSSKAAGYFIKGYDGEITPEAIRSAAMEAGFVKDTRDPQVAQAAQSQARIGSLASGAQPETASGADAAARRIQEAFERGGQQAMYKQMTFEGLQVEG